MSDIMEQQRQHGEAQELAAKELMGGCIEAAVETADFSTTESGNWHSWLREEVVKALRERDAEIKRLRQLLGDSEQLRAEIERLRELVHGTIERNGKLAEENARLRGLLREGLGEHVRLHVHPHFPAWEKRVREALGE